jgi:hypothetical protein
MVGIRKHSRRGFTGLILGWLAGAWRAGGGLAAAALDAPSTGGAGNSPTRLQSRRYRADAAILFLGVAIYRRAGVGGGEASLQVTDDGGASRMTLFFAAGSDPKRAHGLNRLGWIREVVAASGSNPTQADYFGVLTSSPEESLEHARKAIDGPASKQSLYSAVNGVHTVGRSRSAVAHFEFPSDAVWSDPRLIAAAQSAFRAGANWRETSWPASPPCAPPTFLFELARLLKQRAGQAAGRYVYNEQEYTLELEMEPGAAGTRAPLPVRGRLRNLRTGHPTEFRLWIEASGDSIVPVRIDFQPRSFLRLTFEAEPLQTGGETERHR